MQNPEPTSIEKLQASHQADLLTILYRQLSESDEILTRLTELAGIADPLSIGDQLVTARTRLQGVLAKIDLIRP
jgi:hypothetical protein